MKISGLQKVTLIDYPGNIACTIFFYGCNFKCGFCHNPELVTQENNASYNIKEILRFLEKRKDYLEGVCITGGEPLISLDEEFLKQIKNLGYKIKIDTNGTFPEKLRLLIEKNLVDYIAMDIKSSKEKYSEVANAEVDLDKIEECIKLIANSNRDYEFRTTIIKNVHDSSEILNIALWLNNLIEKKPKRFFLQGFKNNGKFIDPMFMKEKDVDEKYLLELREKIKDYFWEVGVRG